MRFFRRIIALFGLGLSAGNLAADESRESLAVGGQAVMEGIMMRNGSRLALAVRKPDGVIVVSSLPWLEMFKSGFFKRKFLRGFPILLETMVNGIKALNTSATIAIEGQDEEIKPWHLVMTLIVALTLAFALFVVGPHLITIALGALKLVGGVETLSFHVWDGLIKFAMFIGYIAIISRLPDIKRVFQYHGAEHKTISAYEHGEDPVTVDNAAKYSRLHPRCGTTFLLFVLSISIILHAILVPLLLYVWRPEVAIVKHAVVLIFKLLLMIPISALAYETIRVTARLENRVVGALLRGPGLLLQYMTTREPDKQQLEVALVALSEALGDDAHYAITIPEFIRLEN